MTDKKSPFCEKNTSLKGTKRMSSSLWNFRQNKYSTLRVGTWQKGNQLSPYVELHGLH